jgi:hypothetical protein
MVNERISDWINECMKKGYTKEQLKKKLIEKGYSEEDINRALPKPGKKVIIISAVVVLVVIAAIFAYLQIIKASPLAPLQKELEECKQNAILPCIALTEEGKDIAQYSDIYYLGKAVRTNDISWCDKINYTSGIGLCKAYVNQDLSYCDKINTSSKQQCIIQISSKGNCNILNDTYSKDSCLALSTQNSSYCSMLVEECYLAYYGKAYIATGDKSYCKKNTDSKTKECCLELNNLDTTECITSNYFYSCVSRLNSDSVCGGLK